MQTPYTTLLIFN